VLGEAVKNNEVAAGAVRGLLAETPGVVAATTNLLTGSILVIYEVGSGHTSAEILAMLRQHGIVDVQASAPERHAMPPRPSVPGLSVGQVLVRKVGQIALDWSVERALSLAVSVLL
jgi:hypothetical protein